MEGVIISPQNKCEQSSEEAKRVSGWRLSRFIRELTGALNGALKVEAATEEPASNM